MRHRWTPRLPEHADFLSSLPDKIGRPDVAARFAGAEGNAEDAVRAFLAAMVWGYGTRGYGAYRTARILASTADAGVRLQETMQITRADGGPAGFAYLAKYRLKGLGVAFATKYLYFCQSELDTVLPAPILDSIVCNWLATNTHWRPRMHWNLADYRRYCDLISAWSAELQEPPPTVEYLMFASGIGIANQWGDLPPADAPESEIAVVLNALAEAADAFEALPGTTEDDDTFRQTLETLRQIALNRVRSSAS